MVETNIAQQLQQQQLPQQQNLMQQQQINANLKRGDTSPISPLSATSVTSISLPSPIQSVDNHTYHSTPGTGVAGLTSGTMGTSMTPAATTTSITALPAQPGISSATSDEPENIQVINEKPVLERVEKIQHTDLHKRVHIHEKYIQDLIEIREQPMVKRFIHPVQQVKIIDDPVFQVEGKEQADLEVQRLIEELRLRDGQHQVQVEQRSDVQVHDYEPTRDVERQLVKHYVVTKPVITEIHEQPIEEIHEQIIQRIIYEKPVLRVVRAERTLTEVVERPEPVEISQVFSDQRTVPLGTSAVDSMPRVTPGVEFVPPTQSINKAPIGTGGIGSEFTTGGPSASTFTVPPPPPPAPTHGLLFSRKGKGVKPSPVTAPTTVPPPPAPPVPATTTSVGTMGTTPDTTVLSSTSASSPKVLDTAVDTTTTVPLENVAAEPSTTPSSDNYTKKSKIPKVGFGQSVNQELAGRLAQKKQDSDLL